MRSLKIGIQGFEGSFHQEAAEQFFGKNIGIQPARTFHDLTHGLRNNTSIDAAVMAIENSNAGSILQNYHLMDKFDLEITGEIYLRIHQNLMALPGTQIENLTHLHSHPMAFHQSRDYVASLSQVQLVETEDTALSAKYIADKTMKTVGGVASARAAELFGLEILKAKIETDQHNYTRFLVLKRRGEEAAQNGVDKATKASLYFLLPHEPGSLAKVLTIAADEGVNLTKIQSVPATSGENWRYHFYADMIFNRVDQFHSAIQKIDLATSELKVLGTYTKQPTL